MRRTARRVGGPAIGLEDPGELALDLGHRQPADVVSLESGQDGRREAGGLGRGEHEGHEVGRFLERLEEGVPGVLRDLVGLVEDVDLAPELARRVRQAFAELADGIDAAVARRVDLDEVERDAVADGDARRAGIAGVAVAQVGAVDGLGEDPARATSCPVPRGPTKRIAWRDAAGPDRVAERLDDRLLADDLAERLGSPAAVDGLMRNGSTSPASSGRRRAGSKCRAPSVDQIVPVPTMTGGSDQAVPRHPTMIA